MVLERKECSLMGQHCNRQQACWQAQQLRARLPMLKIREWLVYLPAVSLVQRPHQILHSSRQLWAHALPHSLRRSSWQSRGGQWTTSSNKSDSFCSMTNRKMGSKQVNSVTSLPCFHYLFMFLYIKKKGILIFHAAFNCDSVLWDR